MVSVVSRSFCQDLSRSTPLNVFLRSKSWKVNFFGGVFRSLCELVLEKCRNVCVSTRGRWGGGGGGRGWGLPMV